MTLIYPPKLELRLGQKSSSKIMHDNLIILT